MFTIYLRAESKMNLFQTFDFLFFFFFFFFFETFIQHRESQSTANVGVPGAGGAENFVWIKTFWIFGLRLLNKS